MKPSKIGLVLGGGGARGLAHVGVICALEEAGIPIDFIGGSSIGSLIGGSYAQNPNAKQLRDNVVRFIKGQKFKDTIIDRFRQKASKDPDDVLGQLAQQVKKRIIINLAVNRIALFKRERLHVAVQELLTNSNIEECKIPFLCVAADLISGKEILFKNGSIRPAVEGSSAIPGFIPPVDYNGYRLIDGSVVNNFPIEDVRDLGAQFIILIDVSFSFEESPSIENVIDIVMRSAHITTRKLSDILKKKADFVITPNIGNVYWSEFNRIDELIQLGEEAASKEIPRLKKLLNKRKISHILR